MTRQYTGKYKTQVCTQGDCRNSQYRANSQAEGTLKESRVCQRTPANQWRETEDIRGWG